MLAFICLFFPAVVAVRILEGLTRQNLTRKQWVYNYSSYLLLINFVCLGAKMFLLGTGSIPLYEAGEMLPRAAVIYIAMAVVSGTVFAVLQALLDRRVTFTVEENTDARD